MDFFVGHDIGNRGMQNARAQPRSVIKKCLWKEEKIMSCPFIRDGYFGICVAPDAIHVISIDEMERFCFKASYSICPNLRLANGLENTAAANELSKR